MTRDLTKYVTTPQAAEMLGVTRFQVIHLLTIKKITGIKWARDWLIYVPSVQEYLGTKSRRGRPSKSKIPDLERAALMLENFKAWVHGGRIIAIESRPAIHTLLVMCAKDATTDDECEAIKVLAHGSGAPLNIDERQNMVYSGQSD